MIPYPVAPLEGLRILVTRPAAQAATLCHAIEAKGGHAISMPVIAIEALAVTTPKSATTSSYDWLVFISVNAVEHGFEHVNFDMNGESTTKVAAIGKTTATSLSLRKIAVHALPARDSTSEALLAHPDLQVLTNQRVLIVRGAGGRELLREEFLKRGAHVDVLEVYRRTKVVCDAQTLSQLESRWLDEGIDIVTLTSVEILENLWSILSPSARQLLARTPLAVAGERIAQAAHDLGLNGPFILSRGADDDTLLGSIANWHTRAHL